MRFIVGLVLSLFVLAGSAMAADDWDYLITGATVFDGRGTPGQQLDVAVKGERIVFIGRAPESAKAAQVIDASGLILTPGFIDPHTHAWNERGKEGPIGLEHYLTQGVSTVISGNDGGGPVDTGTALRELEARGLGANMALFVGHGKIRKQIMGMADRAPTAAELAAMRSAVRAAMQQGALGLSTGLFYAPGSFAKTDEVIALARVAAQYGGIYDSHIRDESNYTIGLLAAVQETIEIGRVAKIPVHFAHIKALGVDVWGYSAQVIDLIEKAQSQGVFITADQYPWRASGTRVGNALVPRWAMAGGRAELLKRLGDPEVSTRIRAQMVENLRRRGGPDSILLTGGKEEWRALTLAQYAHMRSEDPVATAVHIVRAGDAKIASFNMHEDDIAAFMRQPWVMTSSDGGRGHPRKYGSFPRKYRTYVVDKKVVSLAEFIHRSTYLTAQTFGIPDRGLIRVGAIADILLFDPETFGPLATFAEPAQHSQGVEYMFVGGEIALNKGIVSSILAGKVLVRK